MKTTVEIPDSLFQVITSQAAQRGQDFDSTLTAILHRGIDATPTGEHLEQPVWEVDPKSGFMVIVNGRTPPPENDLTPDRIAEILLQQEVEWHHEATRH